MIATNENLIDCMSRVQTSKQFSYALRNFLDRFYSEPAIEYVSKEPMSLREILNDEGLADAYLAASVAWLCEKYALPQPSWLSSQNRIFSKPWFAAKSPPMKAILLQESPAAFRVRNLFVSANALSRA